MNSVNAVTIENDSAVSQVAAFIKPSLKQQSRKRSKTQSTLRKIGKIM